jgi:outer membrane protein TolC
MQKARDVLLPLEQQRYEQAQAAYRAGEADLTSLLMAEQDLNEGRQKVVELHKKATVTLVKLHRAVGGAGVAATLEGGRK